MAGAASIHSAAEPRWPRSRADPPAATDCNSAHDIPPRNASLATAPLHPLISRIPPQHPKPERRRCLSWDSTRKGSSAWFTVVASRGLPAGGRTRKPRGSQLHPSAVRHPVSRSALLPSEGGLACVPAPALNLSWRCKDKLAGNRWKVGDDPQRIMHVTGGSNDKPGISGLRSARPPAPGKMGLQLSLDRGGP